MRGTKRRAAAVSAAEKPQPAVNDGMLDVASRKGVRCCVECGATSTPQWREGPMGPKTLCNACGVRRQRMLRKQQALSVGTVPTAPVAAVQARRRVANRDAVQAPAPMAVDDDLHTTAAGSGSEHSSDETELNWATHQQPACLDAVRDSQQQQQPQPQLSEPEHHEVEDSCNEEESAAYDLLFFAGVDSSVGGGRGSGGMGPVEGAHMESPEPEGYEAFGWRRSSWRHTGHQQEQEYGTHRHNTRRAAHPVRRSDDFYYYDYDGESEMPEEASGASLSGGAGGAGGRMGAGGKRRRVTASPVVMRVQSRMAPPFSTCEDAADSRPGAMTTISMRHSRGPSLSLPPAPACSSLLPCQRPPPQQQPQQPLQTHCSDLPATPAAATTDNAAHHHPVPAAPCSSSPPAPAAATAAAALPAIPASPLSHASVAASAFPVPALTLPPVAPLPLLSMPMALPVLPLSIPLPSMSVKDLEAISKLQWEFQRACLQLQRANAACEAVSAMVAERREAAASAQEAAASASQQLANGVRSVADQFGLRDVLEELRGATAAAAAASAAAAAAPESAGGTSESAALASASAPAADVGAAVAAAQNE